MAKKNEVAKTEPKKGAIVFTPFQSDTEITLTVDTVKNFLTNNTKSGAEPSTADVVNYMMLCQARKLNPWEGDSYLTGYDTKDGPKFTLITSIQALLKRAEANAGYDGKESGIVVERDGEVVEVRGVISLEGDKLIGGWCSVYRKDREWAEYKTVKFSTYDTGRSRWRVDPEGMIAKVAEAAALRAAFPNTLTGLYTHEEEGSIIKSKDISEQVQASNPLEQAAAEAGAPPAKPPKRRRKAKEPEPDPEPSEEEKVAPEPQEGPWEPPEDHPNFEAISMVLSAKRSSDKANRAFWIGAEEFKVEDEPQLATLSDQELGSLLDYVNEFA